MIKITIDTNCLIDIESGEFYLNYLLDLCKEGAISIGLPTVVASEKLKNGFLHHRIYSNKDLKKKN